MFACSFAMVWRQAGCGAGRQAWGRQVVFAPKVWSGEASRLQWMPEADAWQQGPARPIKAARRERAPLPAAVTRRGAHRVQYGVGGIALPIKWQGDVGVCQMVEEPHDLHLVAVAGSSQEAAVGQWTTFNMQPGRHGWYAQHLLQPLLPTTVLCGIGSAAISSEAYQLVTHSQSLWPPRKAKLTCSEVRFIGL